MRTHTRVCVSVSLHVCANVYLLECARYSTPRGSPMPSDAGEPGVAWQGRLLDWPEWGQVDEGKRAAPWSVKLKWAPPT